MKTKTAYVCEICNTFHWEKEDAEYCEKDCIKKQKITSLNQLLVGEKGFNIFGEIDGVNCLIINKLQTIKRNDIQILFEAKNIKTNEEKLTKSINSIINK